MPDTPPDLIHWPYLATLLRLALAVGTGIFVGLEREHRGKAGARTFAFAALLGCLGGLTGDAFAILSLLMLSMFVGFLNWRQIHLRQSLALTTSAALLIVGYAGVLCGKGHTFTPVAVTAITAALLAWKQPLTGFATGLTQSELRSAILLVLLSFVVYPVLPEHVPKDTWHLIEPRSTWATVILVAAIGFVNYLLWKVYGTRGVEITGFLGGLVNSTAAVAELAGRTRQLGERFVGTAYRGVMLATAAMLLRNGVLLGLLATSVLTRSLLPIGLMFAASLAASRLRLATPASEGDAEIAPLQLEAPFSLRSALRFGLLFLVLHVAGVFAQRSLGALGFYAVSLAGGLFSSASAVASAATLAAHGSLPVSVAANGATLASLTSALVNLPLIARVAAQPRLTSALNRALGGVTALGLLGAVGAYVLFAFFLRGS